MSQPSNNTPEWMEAFKSDMLKEMQSMINNSLAIHSERTTKLAVTSSKHSGMINHLQVEHKVLSDRLTRLETYSVRDNIIISGITEDTSKGHEGSPEGVAEGDAVGVLEPDTNNVTATENLMEKVIGIFEEHLELHDIQMVRCHRLPTPKQSTRPQMLLWN